MIHMEYMIILTKGFIKVRSWRKRLIKFVQTRIWQI